MGFFDFLKKPREEEAKPVVDTRPVEVEIDSLEKKINDHVSDMLSRERERAKDLYSKIREDFGEIKRMGKELEGKKFEESDRMYSAVNMIKNNYVNRTFGLLGGVPLVQEMSHEELDNFHSKTTKVLDGMRKVPPKQAILLSKYFKKEASQIVKILKKIEDNLNEMKSLLSEGKPISLVNRITSRARGIMEMKRKFDDLEHQEKVLKEKIRKLESEKESKQGDLEDLLKSEGYREIVDSREKVRDLRQEKENLESELREEFSSIKRPLKKYEHILRNDPSIPRERRISFEKMIHSPVKSILAEGGESVLSEMVSKVSESMEKGMISLKESERKKFGEFSEKIKEGKISDLRKRYDGLREMIEESEKRKGKDVLNEREKIKREIEHSDHEISEYERNLENISKGKKSTKSGILGEKEKLERTIEREMGRKFVIKLF
ncbi:MAG: hypothetical protein GTN39_02980 [Candidatus Aenigmarchaeota archaeon]|nr:hypothetical protein [Candidatus Aenigmarchaeota archaeon]